MLVKKQNTTPEPSPGGYEPFIIYPEGTMQTSTLPSIAVPKLTGNDVSQAITALSQGRPVIISTNYGVFFVAESDTDNVSIKIPYYNYFVTYEENEEESVAEYVKVGGLYQQSISAPGGGYGAAFSIKVTTTEKEPFTKATLKTAFTSGKILSVYDVLHESGAILAKETELVIYYLNPSTQALAAGGAITIPPYVWNTVAVEEI